MTMPASEHCYASTADFRGLLAGASAQTWDGDEVALTRLLATASRVMERRIQRSWGPRKGSRSYTVSPGFPLPGNPLFPLDDSIWGWETRPLWPDGIRNTNDNDVILGDWLLSATAVTLDGNAIVAGTDYEFWPASTPMNQLHWLVAAPGTALSITGTWGWPYDLDPLTTLASGIDASVTTLNVGTTDAALLSPGQTLQIENEQLAVRVLRDGATIFVRRGVNGTTAAAHDSAKAVSLMIYPDDVSQACIDITKARFRGKDAGQSQIIGDPQMSISLPRPGAEEEAIIKSLKRTYDGRALAGTRF